MGRPYFSSCYWSSSSAGGGLSEEHPTRLFRVPPIAEHRPQVYVIRRNKNNRNRDVAILQARGQLCGVIET